jgi:putative PIG3 family NAD(P)H quinone oxidoreductase
MSIRARAVRIEGKGDVDVLALGELSVPEPGASELLVEVAAAGLNRADLLQRMGFYPAPPGVPPDVPGLEYAGTVSAVGDAVDGFRVGDRVMGIVAGGAMATHLTVHAREAIPVPAGMSLADAAAIPEVFLTAYDGLARQGGMAMGQVVLIHAAGSGIGTAAIQLAREAGARPFGTARSAGKLERCRELGMEGGIHVEEGRFAKALVEAAEGRAADVILDTVGAAYLGENVAAVASGGTIVVIGLLGGAKGELALAALLARRARIIGSVLRSRPLEEKATLSQDFIRHVLPGLQSRRLRPVVDRVIPMTDIREAHRYMASNESFGKIVLAW